MSVYVMNWVWKHSSHGDTGLLLMLAIADHCNEDGGGAYPSIKALAEKARVSTRTVKRQLQLLEESGELIIERNAGPKGVNLYQVTFQRGGDNLSPPDEETIGADTEHDASAQEGDTDDTNDPGCHGDTGGKGGCHPWSGGVTPVVKRGDIAMSHGTVKNRQLTVKEPSGRACERASPGEMSVKSSAATSTLKTPEDEPVGAPPAPPPETANRRANAAAKPNQTVSPPLVDEEFRAKMREKYPALDVDSEIDAALNHTAVKKAISTSLYVRNWLRRAEQWRQERPSPTARAPAKRPEINADPDTYSFFGGR